MRRLTFLLAATGAVVLLVVGTALADMITCTTNPCNGTEHEDTITGTNTRNVIRALGGADTVDSRGGNDEIYGGEDADIRLSGEAGNDKVYGGPGADNIFTNESPDTNPGVDTVKGGRGNDGIDAADGFKDLIDCGRGPDDFVIFDQGLDKIAANCEDRSPQP
jgi:Ca2+-binding RTX toxin-like protein